MADPVRVGVLSLHESKASKAILNAAADLGAETAWLRRENLESRTTTARPRSNRTRTW